MGDSQLATRHTAFPPPLWGRVGERGNHELQRPWLLPSLTLPHKGGGNGDSVLPSRGDAA